MRGPQPPQGPSRPQRPWMTAPTRLLAWLQEVRALLAWLRASAEQKQERPGDARPQAVAGTTTTVRETRRQERIVAMDSTKRAPETQPSVPIVPEVACRSCGVIGPPVVTPGTGPHYARLNCGSCGTFLRWLSRYSPAERIAHRQQALRQAMAQRPPSVPQLAYLKALGDTGPVPATMAEASARIEALRRDKGVA